MSGRTAMDPFDKDPGVAWGVAEEVAPGVRRVTARNPSAFTFTGTRSYLLGRGAVALIDPGPDDGDHVAAIMSALGPGERIARVLVTHSHRDHTGAVPAIAAATGADVIGFGPHGSGMSETMRRLAASGAALGGGEGGDPDFVPDRCLSDGEAVEGDDWRLVALHTPGHLSNHLSFALEGTGIVFTGDTVMGFATTLVSPPEGDMAAFMASLERLAGRDDRLYLPGHGHPVRDPAAMLAWQIAHRRQRFGQIMDALRDGPADAATLARRIYTEVDPGLLPAAARNVLASLIGLADQGEVRPHGPIAAEAVFELA
ncbi:MAG TPA: MBL fold metallo-hydrolase [Paracoccaceae bacterium]|nr:MBL fold metallo-hydrolase [Paracoccaceae bacterium]